MPAAPVTYLVGVDQTANNRNVALMTRLIVMSGSGTPWTLPSSQSARVVCAASKPAPSFLLPSGVIASRRALRRGVPSEDFQRLRWRAAHPVCRNSMNSPLYVASSAIERGRYPRPSFSFS